MTEQELDTEALVFRQIDRIMRTASMDLESLTSANGPDRTMDPATWSHKVVFSCEFLHAFLRPSMTEEKYQKIFDKAREPFEGQDSLSPWNRIRKGKIIFKEDVSHLHQNNMVFQESDNLVIEDKSEEKLEPEDSEVSEEVIE